MMEGSRWTVRRASFRRLASSGRIRRVYGEAMDPRLAADIAALPDLLESTRRLAVDGAFVSGATMSTVVGLAIAREWLGEELGVDVSRDGVRALGDVSVFSGSAHSSVFKALSMLGLGRDSIRAVPVLPGREAEL